VYQEAVGVRVKREGGHEGGEGGEGVRASPLLDVPHAHAPLRAARRQQAPRGVHCHALDKPVLAPGVHPTVHQHSQQEQGAVTACSRQDRD